MKVFGKGDKAKSGQDTRERADLETVRFRVARFIDVFGWEDLLCAVVVAGITVAFQFFWSYPIVHPVHWEWASLATWTRPPEGPVQSLWMAFASLGCRVFGVDGGLALMRGFGHLAVGLLSVLVYYFLRFAFSQRFALPPEELEPCVTRLRLVTVAGALVFAFSESVWRQGQFFSSDLMRILLVATAVVCYLVYRRRGSLVWYGFAYLFAGVLSAETPIGIMLALGFFVAGIFHRLHGYLPFRMELIDRDPRIDEFSDGSTIHDIDDEIVNETRQVSTSLENWSFCLFYFMPFMLTLLAEAWLFGRFGGMEVKRLGNWDYPMIFMSSWIGSVRNAISVDSILIASALMLLPFLVAFLLLPLATDSKCRLAFPVGGLIVMMGIGAETQFGPWAPFWYWTWGGRETGLMPGAVQMLMAYFGAAAVTGGLHVLTCASRRRVLGVDTLLVAETSLHARLRKFGALLVILLTLSLVGSSVAGRRQTFLRAKLAAMGEYVRLQARHAAGTRWLFTDGSFDDALRVAFRRVGATTRPISVVSGHDPYETYLRSVEAQDLEDVPMLEASGSEALRFWVGEKPGHLARSAAQVGYRALNKAKGRRPRTAGTALRVARSPDDQLLFSKFDAETRDFSRRVLRLVGLPHGALDGRDLAVDRKFDFLLWRLARMADQRARGCSIAGDAEGERREHELSADLDRFNVSLRTLASTLERLRPTEGVVLTPREGLHIALRRADFELARRYAEMVMRVDPDDEQANFALAMWALETHDYLKAVRHFEAAIRRNPSDSTLLNNVALAYLKAGRRHEALEKAEAARKLLPDSEVVKRLIDEIKKAADRTDSTPVAQ